ncbi:hypothetical protein [Allorhizobium taibaishanense]|uniref:Uncharacterized protein n=1 Tax=Allorhizobium taibaishanense TaxID=887144 RepID=A0A1Q8ZZP1_9HYPH|nr:hypothetical protein [Allorhizobium taibaishanense]MBB4007369.1 hypothetical protein [Allorhizobium taibaishanense]OLP47659.1 hypothetical protein BJF91_04520 [Allorhizobium taibaishanense]
MTEIAWRLTAVTLIMALFAAAFSMIVSNHSRTPYSLSSGMSQDRGFIPGNNGFTGVNSAVSG